MRKILVRRMTAVLVALCSAPFFMADSPSAQAQFAVIDVANLSENIQTEFHTLVTTVNQATQIANQITQLAHEATNLVNMPAAMAAQLINAYMQAFNALNQTWNAINGLAGNIATLTARYNTLYPNRQVGGTVTPAQVLAQTQGFLTEIRSELQGADQLAAQVASQMPSNQTQLNTATTALSNSPGALDAIQSAGHIQAIAAMELAQTNALILGMNQAQVAMLAQQVQDRDDAAKRSTDLAVQYPAAPLNPVPYVP